jgi:hypothetical protein
MLTVWGILAFAGIDYERLDRRTVIANSEEIYEQAYAKYKGWA